LDNLIRRWLQNPQKIVGPLIKEGMTVLDVGCGPGFFSIDMARMVGSSGRVIAADLQDGMLRKLETKIQETKLQERITPHKCEANGLGVSERVDFVLAFYVVHELPRQDAFFAELKSLLKPGGQVLIVEPAFHVSRKEFDATLKMAASIGFAPAEGPKLLLSRTAILRVCD